MIEQPTTEETAPEAKSETRPLDLKEHSPLNVFTCGPKMRVTDPCYSRDTWCTAVFDVKPGEYQAHYLLKDMGEWGNRVAELAVVHQDVDLDTVEWKSTEENAGVDSGQCGFYSDDKYPDSTGEYGDEDTLYGKTCEATLSDKRAAEHDHGVFTSSGFGDGGYDVFKVEQDGVIVGLALIFIYPEEDEEDEEEEPKRMVGAERDSP